jgi:long-chain acyl-CoA synthetase
MESAERRDGSSRRLSFTLTDADNAPAILFRQAARPERRDRPRLMVPGEQGWTPVTWGELSRRVQRLASFLVDRGVDRDVKAAVLASTRVEWCVAGMAILAARGVLCPLDRELEGAALRQRLEHSETRVLVVEDRAHLREVLAWLPETAIHTVICFEPFDLEEVCLRAGFSCEGAIAERLFTLADAEGLGEASLARDACRIVERTAAIRLDDPGYLVYTPASSPATVRGVLLSHRNVGASGAAWVEANGPLCHDGDRDLLCLPLSSLFGLGELCLGNQLGFLSYLSEPGSVAAHLAEVRPHILMCRSATWTQLAALARGAGEDEAGQAAELRRVTGGRLYFCLAGGGELPREVKELFLRAGILLCEGYGRSECGPTLTMNRYNDFDFDSVGKPITGVELRLSEEGEILARGANVFAGYYRDPEATRAVLDPEGWFHTGDRGRWSERGFLILDEPGRRGPIAIDGCSVRSGRTTVNPLRPAGHGRGTIPAGDATEPQQRDRALAPRA